MRRAGGVSWGVTEASIAAVTAVGGGFKGGGGVAVCSYSGGYSGWRW